MGDRKNGTVRTLMLDLMAGISPGDCRKRTKYSGKKNEIPTFIGIQKTKTSTSLHFEHNPQNAAKC